MRASGGSTFRSRPCPSWSSTPSSRPRTRISTSTAASTSPASRAPRCCSCSNYGSGPAPAGRLDHHPAGRQELPAHQRAVVLAQDQGSAAGDEDRADLLQGQDPRALSQRDLSRHGRLRRRRRLAALFRQVGARTDRPRKRPISRRCPRRRTTIIRSASASARIERRNYVLDRMAEDRLHHRAGGGEGQEGAAQGHAAADRRPHLRRRIFRRGSAPLHLRELHREEALRGRPLGAHHARPQDAGAGAQGAGRRLREFRRAAGLSRARQQARHGERLGRQARRDQGAGRHRAVAARGGAGGRATARPASACSPGATRAARSPRSARPACFRSKA